MEGSFFPFLFLFSSSSASASNNILISLLPSVFHSWTKLIDLRIGRIFPLPIDSGIAPLTTLRVDYITGQEEVDSLPTSFSGSYHSLKKLELWFDGGLESYDSLNEFLSSCIQLESLIIMFSSVRILEDSVFLKTISKLKNLENFEFSYHTDLLPLEFIFKLPELKTLSYRIHSSRDKITASLIDLLQNDKRRLGVEKIILKVYFRTGVNEEAQSAVEGVVELLRKLKVVAELRGIKVMVSRRFFRLSDTDIIMF